MRIKRLELYGFKSFADRQVFNFETGVTCIVGPNGCGKSNVVDAMKWVLGEQSAKSLRGDAMLDVIFNGSSSRRPLGYAEVSLAFDNTDKTLPVDYEEVAVTRRLYRSGESEYFVNKQLCRLRDIKELLMDTGLGTRTYSVIEQGKVDGLLQANPTERRIVFEEAAGISKYKARKLAAMRKLDRVVQNLDVLGGIIEEVDKSLRSINRQASKARRYLEISEELKGKRVILAMADYAKQLEELGAVQSELASVGDRERTLTADAAELQAYLTEAQNSDDEISDELQSVEARRLEAVAAMERLDAQRSYAAKRAEELEGEAAGLEAEAGGELSRKAEIEAALERLRAELEKHQRESGSRTADLSLSRQRCAAKLEELRTAEDLLEDLKTSTMDLLRERSTVENRISAGESELRGFEARLDRIDSRRCELSGRLRELDARGRVAADELRAADESETALSAEHARVRASRDETESRVATLDAEINGLRTRLEAARSRLGVLEDLESSYEGVSAGVRGILEAVRSASREGKAAPEGVLGMLADLIEVDAERERAVEAALGSHAEALVVETAAQAAAAMEFLRTRGLGEATFLPLDSVRPVASPATSQAAGHDGVVGPAASFVRSSERVRPAVDALLGSTLVMRDLASARERSMSGLGAVRAVTLTGEAVERTGAMRGGSVGSAATGLVSRKGEIARLRAAVSAVEAQLSGAAHGRRELAENLSSSRARLEELTALIRDAASKAADLRRTQVALADDSERLAEEIEVAGLEHSQTAREQGDVALRISKLKRAAGNLAGREEGLALRVEATSAAVGEARSAYDGLQRRHSEMQVAEAHSREKAESVREAVARGADDLSECVRRAEARSEQASRCRARRADLVRQAESMREELSRLLRARDESGSASDELKAKREELRASLVEARKKERELAQVLEDVRAEMSEQRVRESETRMRLEAVIDRAGSEFKVDLAAEYEKAEAEAAITPELTEEVSKLQAQLERMGAVNLYALEELKQLQERSEFLHTQHTDLVEARESLRAAIAKINRKSRALFAETFEQVAGNFHLMFRKLFGGGKAEVKLEEGVDVLEAGIDIMAKPPGKELRSMSLLSGGEKALTTIALLFAIFQSKPSPFCILDEVDAPLDEANVDRFNLIVKEFMETTQFIIITHNKLTMTYGDLIYGVTMQEAGVSKRISVSLEDLSDEGLAVA